MRRPDRNNAHQRRHGRWAVLAVACLASLAAAPARAERTDQVLIVNGNTITGEIKELNQGLLKYKTDSAGTIYVEWVDVVRLTSRSSFQVETTEGDLYFGALVEPAADRQIRVSVGSFHLDVDTVDVARIRPIKEGFWATLDGAVNLGVQYTSSTRSMQASLLSNVERWRKKLLSRVDLRLVISRTGEEPTKKNNSLGFSQYRFLGKLYAAGASLQFQQNDELGINFRTLLGASGSRTLVQALRQNAVVTAGLAYNRENVTAGGYDESLEAELSAKWNVFKFKTPKTNLTTTLAVYPGLTQRGRVRTQYDLSLSQELVKDFMVTLAGFFNSDNQPPDPGAASSDWSVNLGVGYTY